MINEKSIAENLSNPYNFTDGILKKKTFKISVGSHHINLINSKITTKPYV